MNASYDERGFSIFTALRQPNANPRHSQCALALQRICGTCAHYRGQLHPAGGEPTHAGCDHFGTEKALRTDAGRCRQWTRRG